jgi:site-specific DNA recombinase
MKIPPLLDDSIIAAIHERAKGNKTYTHGEIKHHYLLSRMIFCAECGYTLFGYTNHNGLRYYRHPKYRKNACTYSKFLPADAIENAVLLQLSATFGDKERIEKAIKRATPDLEKLEGLMVEKEQLTDEQKKITVQKNSIIDSIADQVITKNEAKIKMEKLRDRETAISNRLHLIEAEINNIPDPNKIKRLSSLGIRVLQNATKNPRTFFKKSYEWKRNLVEHAFAGRNPQGDRFGVYVKQTDNPDEIWQFEIRGTFESTIVALPLSEEYLIETFHLDSEYQDIKKELDMIKSNFALSSPIPFLL